MFASPCIIVFALAKVFRTRGPRRKWLWCLIAVFGICAFRMNWADGSIAIDPIYLEILGAGFVRGGSRFSPWILSVALPIGAALIVSGVWAKPRQPDLARRDVPNA